LVYDIIEDRREIDMARGFEDLSTPDLLRVIRYCQKLFEDGITCEECLYYKNGRCDGKRWEDK